MRAQTSAEGRPNALFRAAAGLLGCLYLFNVLHGGWLVLGLVPPDGAIVADAEGGVDGCSGGAVCSCCKGKSACHCPHAKHDIGAKKSQTVSKTMVGSPVPVASSEADANSPRSVPSVSTLPCGPTTPQVAPGASAQFEHLPGQIVLVPVIRTANRIIDRPTLASGLRPDSIPVEPADKVPLT
ncbi:MAG TPA: hypothetical protein VL860_08680 [Planctomycetota bacterium]|nr:hypothetical protein [Planctomycetota bacterium]